MERLWVALLVVGITAIFASDIGGSVLHGIEGQPDYLQWIPHELLYTNIPPPILLSQLHHGLRIDEASAIRNGIEQGQSQRVPAAVVEEAHSPLLLSKQHHGLRINEALAIRDGVEQRQSQRVPAAVVEEAHSPVLLSQQHHGLRINEALSVRDRNEPGQSQYVSLVEKTPTELLPVPPSTEHLAESSRNIPITEEELFDGIFGRQSGSSKGDNDAVMPPSEQSNSKVSKTPVTQPISDTLVVESSDPPIPVTQTEGSSLLPETKQNNSATASKVNIITGVGKLHMEASLQSRGKGDLELIVGEITTLHDNSSPENNTEPPALQIAKEPKPNILTTVNVSVNVNGDGTGSVINSTSAADITTPIKTNHKKCN
ncbi:uncharacterized protein LOC129942101 [Eupeodes corollae]|uniref:uncharacterized protein LOC129942101 n=1 Tax=Eupeodes corollae TaxID=290404 RepID=UPI0024939E08|nr:uncharacterized protein LOC129942101 [Eupeodes corollae]